MHMTHMLKVSNMIRVIFCLLPQSAVPGVLPEDIAHNGAHYRRCEARFPQVIPAGDHAVLHVLLHGQDAPIALGLVTHVAVLLPHAHHDTLVLGAQ